MDAEYFRMLFQYNCWANARIIRKSAEVEEADYFGPRAGLSFGTLHHTLLHLVGAEMTWARRLSGGSAPSITVEEMPDLASLVGLAREAEALQALFLDTLSESELDRVNSYTWAGNRWAHKLAHQLAHWINHATQYRSEAAVRLTELGLSPGNLDLLGWLHGLQQGASADQADGRTESDSVALNSDKETKA